LRDVTIRPKREEFVSRMAPRRSDARSKGVPSMPKRVEFVSPMEQRRNDVVTRDVTIKSTREEFVGNIAQKTSTQQTTTMSLLSLRLVDQLTMIMKKRRDLIHGFGSLRDVMH
jgi:hypothetical protein